VRASGSSGALLHDVGKIHVPNAIIKEPGPLDDEEWVVLKTHTIEGQKMLERVGGILARVRVVARLARALGRRRLPRRAGAARRSRSRRASCRPATWTTR
jgi:hypothetical protein